jgi:hypothetical protein
MGHHQKRSSNLPSQPFGAIDCALVGWLPCRGVHQALALPAAEILPAINLSAPATALQARQPLSPAAKARRGICEWYELVDHDPLAVAIGDIIPKPNAVVPDNDLDRARPLTPARPRKRCKVVWAQDAVATQTHCVHGLDRLPRYLLSFQLETLRSRALDGLVGIEAHHLAQVVIGQLRLHLPISSTYPHLHANLFEVVF